MRYRLVRSWALPGQGSPRGAWLSTSCGSTGLCCKTSLQISSSRRASCSKAGPRLGSLPMSPRALPLFASWVSKAGQGNGAWPPSPGDSSPRLPAFHSRPNPGKPRHSGGLLRAQLWILLAEAQPEFPCLKTVGSTPPQSPPLSSPQPGEAGLEETKVKRG